MERSDRLPMILTSIVLVLAIIAAGCGLFVDGTYRDNTFVQNAWLGNDIGTLFVAVPLMIIALLLMKRGSQVVRLLWMSSLWYMTYNYMFYLYGAAFNKLFLVYIAIFTLSTYGLIMALIKTDASRIKAMFSKKTPIKFIGIFMLCFAGLLGGLWLMMSASYLFTGVIPATVEQTGHTTAVVFATDLSLLVPAIAVSAVMLLKRQPWGYVFTGVVLVKASTYGLVMLIMSLISYIKTDVMEPLAALWLVLTVGCVLCTVLHLGNMKNATEQKEQLAV